MDGAEIFAKIKDHDNNHLKFTEKISRLDEKIKQVNKKIGEFDKLNLDITKLKTQMEQIKNRRSWWSNLISVVIGGILVYLFPFICRLFN